MEFFLFICTFLLFCFILLKIAKKSKPVKLPPGPRPLPIIGNLHQLTGSLPHRILADLAKKHGPLMHLWLGEVSTIVVSSAEVAREIMNEHDIIFANRPFLLSPRRLVYNCTDITFSPYGDHWRQLRKICTVELMSQKRVQTFESVRIQEVEKMIESISSKEGSVVNLSQMLPSLVYSIITHVAYGKRSRHHDAFVLVMKDVVKLLSVFNIADMFPSVKILAKINGMERKLQRAQRQTDAILESILTEHKEKRAASSKTGNGKAKEDLVDVLLKVQNSGEFGAPLTDDHLKALIFNIFGAGGDTSAKTMEWAMAEMINNPRTLKRAQAEVRQIYGERGIGDESRLHELKYLKAIIKETLRLHPPAPMLLPRESSEPCQVHGFLIPAKTRLFINGWAINRDPKHWVEPEVFNPERFLESDFNFQDKNLNYIPFGVGRRICPGISLGLANMELPLAQLLYHFDWKVPGELKQLDMTESFGLAFSRKKDLLLIPTFYCHP